jgi:DNA-directed RNA polymerase specialized sigma24 family protein
VPDPAAKSAERKVLARRQARQAARRRELVTELRVGESVIGYAARVLANGASPAEARETALEASAELSRLAVALRKSVRLPVAQRRSLVSRLTGLGYTHEAAAARAGVSVKTVRRDLAVCPSRSGT